MGAGAVSTSTSKRQFDVLIRKATPPVPAPMIAKLYDQISMVSGVRSHEDTANHAEVFEILRSDGKNPLLCAGLAIKTTSPFDGRMSSTWSTELFNDFYASFFGFFDSNLISDSLSS